MIKSVDKLMKPGLSSCQCRAITLMTKTGLLNAEYSDQITFMFSPISLCAPRKLHPPSKKVKPSNDAYNEHSPQT